MLPFVCIARETFSQLVVSLNINSISQDHCTMSWVTMLGVAAGAVRYI